MGAQRARAVVSNSNRPQPLPRPQSRIKPTGNLPEPGAIAAMKPAQMPVARSTPMMLTWQGRAAREGERAREGWMSM